MPSNAIRVAIQPQEGETFRHGWVVCRLAKAKFMTKKRTTFRDTGTFKGLFGQKEKSGAGVQFRNVFGLGRTQKSLEKRPPIGSRYTKGENISAFAWQNLPRM